MLTPVCSRLVASSQSWQSHWMALLIIKMFLFFLENDTIAVYIVTCLECICVDL